MIKFTHIKGYPVRSILGVVLLCLSSFSQAATVILDGTNTYATRIESLQIGVDFYDVDFEFLDGTVTPITFTLGDVFVGDALGAKLAADVIAAELNAQIVYKAGMGAIGTGGFSVVVPYSDLASLGCLDICAYRSNSTFGIAPFGPAGDSDIFEDAKIDFARFTLAPTPVPVPPALYLFLSGITMLGWKLKRRVV